MSKFDIDKVRSEIEHIVRLFPDATGAYNTDIENEYDGEVYTEPSCVYFLDEDGNPVNTSNFVIGDVSPRTLVEPVCIVGQWVHMFHPELKQDDDFLQVLATNAVIKNSDKAQKVLGPEVQEYLGHIQNQQDSGQWTWSELDLEVL